jgi:urocanate hydratase
MAILADGSEDAEARLRRCFWNDPASGVMRHADAGYPVARHAAAKHQLNLPMLAKKWP